MKTWLFPGQGSQKKGMGAELFSEFSDLVAQADTILGYSIQDLCLNNPDQKLNQTLYTQPALYVVNALSFLQKSTQETEQPDFFAGHSLGEYNALFAANAFDFTTGLRLVKKRAELFNQAVDGAMAAIVNLNLDDLRRLLEEYHLDRVDIANINAPHQIVVAGLRTDIDQIEKIIKDNKNIHFFRLSVSGAFHSRYMADAQEQFAEFLTDFSFNELEVPVIANVTAQPYEQEKITANLIAQVTQQVNWLQSIQYLMHLGDMHFEEVGPGTVLTKLLPKIKAAPFLPKETKTTHASQLPVITTLAPESLGSHTFKQDYGIRYAYVTGGMVKGISSAELVIRLGKMGLMGYFGTGGLTLAQIENGIRQIQQELCNGEAYGMNFLHNPHNPQHEMDTVDLFLTYGVRCIETAAFIQITPAYVKYRVKGLHRDATGKVVSPHKIMAKLSRLEFVETFLSPPPKKLVDKLLTSHQISPEEAELSQFIPLADDLCVEADSAGQTDSGVLSVLLPTILRQRDQLMAQQLYSKPVHVGAAGGIGSPEAAAAAFMLGADFILTGSINQCTVEAGTSNTVKAILQQLTISDTTYVPAGELFELGAKSQVVRQGVSFPVRANKLYDLYQHHSSLADIDDKTQKQLQETYFKRGFDEIYTEVKQYYTDINLPHIIEKAEKMSKFKMALIFKWYFAHTLHLAIQGDAQHKMDYQIYCGPAMGAFNQWVKGTNLQNWQQRHVDVIADRLMQETAAILMQRYTAMNIQSSINQL